MSPHRAPATVRGRSSDAPGLLRGDAAVDQVRRVRRRRSAASALAAVGVAVGVVLLGEAVWRLWAEPPRLLTMVRVGLFVSVVCTLAAIAVHLLKRPRQVVVFGDDAFAEWVGAAAAQRGRRVVAHVSPSGQTPPDARVDVALHDEAIVDSRLFENHGNLDLTCPGLLADAPRLLVVQPRLMAPSDSVNHETSTALLDPNPFDHPIPAAGRWFKRALDIAVATIAILLTLPVLMVALVAIRLDTKGPAFFRQTRLGIRGRKFRFYKLRTMNADNDDTEHRKYLASLIRGDAGSHDGLFKLTADPRITRVGRMLRRYSIDELPQLFNVLRGDMSLVGPRPPLPNEAALYDPAAWQRLRVKPGLTGLWQVSGRSEIGFREMVELDVAYWQYWSPLLDLRILARTPSVALLNRTTA